MSATYDLSLRMKFIALMSVCIMSMPLFAKNGPETAISDNDSIYKNIQISDIYISSGKVYGKLSELPISVTTLSSTDLKMRNVTNIKDFKGFRVHYLCYRLCL